MTPLGFPTDAIRFGVDQCAHCRQKALFLMDFTGMNFKQQQLEFFLFCSYCDTHTLSTERLTGWKVTMTFDEWRIKRPAKEDWEQLISFTFKNT